MIWILYNEMDASGNDWYINHYIECFLSRGIKARLILSESLVIDKLNKIFLYEEKNIDRPLAVINRTRDYTISEFFEEISIPVFNSGIVTLLGNDKYEAYKYIKNIGVPVVDTRLIRKTEAFALENFSDKRILKSIHGHGGTQVFMVTAPEQIQNIREAVDDDMILQPCVSDTGRDLRVYVVGNKIVAGMLRVSDKDFRSNFCLGGEAVIHELTDLEREYSETILKNLSIAHGAIDFIYDNGKPVFNELEDMCGSRMLYKYTDLDIVDMYVNFIVNEISR